MRVLYMHGIPPRPPPMPIDYSKWDKIELSDDSDIEVHPNVDKKSFIKWKQRDIHEKRHQRNVEIKSILLQLTMYAKLNQRVDLIVDQVPLSDLLDTQKIMALVNERFDPNEKFDFEKLKEEKSSSIRKGLKDITFDRDEVENTPPYNEMIEDLFTQIKDDHEDARHDASKLLGYLTDHRNKIDNLLLKQALKLDELLYQKSLLISSDDYHTGFDRSFLNVDGPEQKSEKEPQPADSGKTEAKASETQASGAKGSEISQSAAHKKDGAEKTGLPHSVVPSAPLQGLSSDEQFDELKVLPETLEFSRISPGNLEQSAQFLIKHYYICTEHQKDSLIMTAFDFQLQENPTQARQVVYQSLLLQYISQLAGPKASKDQTIRATKLFFSKLSDASSPACQAFNQDVENTAAHIRNRCKIIQEEQQTNDEEALIQLKALDESTTLEVNPPVEGTPEHAVFMEKLSPEMRQAIGSGSLDEVNKIFATMKVEEAEKVLEIFNECNVIGISGVLENEEEFERLKDQYDDHHLQHEETPAPKFSTADEVD